MSIQDWAGLAEIVGAIAVVVSLIYLAVQIRQNTHQLSLSLKSTELAAFERNVESGNRSREMFILNPDVAALYLRGLDAYAELEASDKMRFDMLLSNLFSAMQGAYIRELTYNNDPDSFAGSQRTLDLLIRRQSVRDWLDRSRPDWRPEFVSLVEQRVRHFEEANRSAGKSENKNEED